MQVLVTGATGYIGGAVAEALGAAGHGVIATARTPEKVRLLEKQGYRACLAGLENPGALARAAQEADGVIHTALAWGESVGAVDRKRRREHAGGPRGFRQAVRLYQRLLGDGQDTRPRRRRVRPARSSSRGGLAAVGRVVQDAGAKKVRGVLIRPAMLYGRGGGILAEFVRSARERGLVRFVGTGENHWTFVFVHVDDLADLYVRALEKAPAGDVFLAAEGPAYTVREVVETAGRAGGAGARAEPWPVEEARRCSARWWRASCSTRSWAAGKRGVCWAGARGAASCRGA